MMKPPPLPKNRKKPDNTLKIVAVVFISVICSIGILIVLVIAISAFDSVDDRSKNTPQVQKKKVVKPKVEDDSFWAQNISETFVKRALTAPRTAKFPRLSQKYPEEGVVVNKIGPQKYQVKSWVDSQNAFGAMVRTEYYIELEMKGDQWSASEFFLDGKKVY